MNIHEYQAKKILSRYGVFVPRGKIAYTPNEAKNAAVHVSMRGPWMLKAQIQSGAREKGYFMEEKAVVSVWLNAEGKFLKRRSKCSVLH